jgi:hypothetical protein
MSKDLARKIAAIGYIPLSMLLPMLSMPSDAWAVENLENKVNDGGLVQRGAALRRDIEEEYTRLKSGHALKSWKKGNDVTAIAVKYLPAGTTFSDGEAILRAAGFQVVLPPPDSVSHPTLDYRDNVLGILQLEQSFPSVVKASISLSPSASGDYGIVGRVKAGISVSSL